MVIGAAAGLARDGSRQRLLQPEIIHRGSVLGVNGALYDDAALRHRLDAVG